MLLFAVQITAKLNIYYQTKSKNPLWTETSENILSRFLSFCVQAKFWEWPI